MSQTPPEVTNAAEFRQQTSEIGPAVVKSEELQASGLKIFDIRSKFSVDGYIPIAVVNPETVVFNASAPAAVDAQAATAPGKPNEKIFTQTKVDRHEGFYQSAARITPGFNHEERLALAHAMKAQYAEEVKTRPELAGRKPDGSDMRINTHLLRADNFDAVMEKLKKANPEIAAKVLAQLTKQDAPAPAANPYAYSGAPEDGKPNPNPTATRIVEPVAAPVERRPVRAADPAPVEVAPLAVVKDPNAIPGSNSGRSGAPAPGSDAVLPLKLPTPSVAALGDGPLYRSVNDRNNIYLHQTDSFGCAAFSLEMALADMQGRRPLDANAKALENAPVAGTTMRNAGRFPGQLGDMAKLANDVGLNSKAFPYNRVGENTLRDMYAEFDKGRSALVRIINPSTGNNHWVYAVGKTEDGRILIADPARRNMGPGGAHNQPISPGQLLHEMNRGGAGFVSVWGTPQQVAMRSRSSTLIARR